MGQKPNDLLGRRRPGEHRIKTGWREAFDEAPRTEAIGEDAPIFVPEFVADFRPQPFRSRRELCSLAAAEFLGNRCQHFGVEREQAVEADVLARQCPRRWIIERLVMDR